MNELWNALHSFWVEELKFWGFLEVDENLDEEVVRRLLELGEEEEGEYDEA